MKVNFPFFFLQIFTTSSNLRNRSNTSETSDIGDTSDTSDTSGTSDKSDTIQLHVLLRKKTELHKNPF